MAFICLQISSITADNVDTYKNAVNKLTDCMDANIKTMYTVMAKTEELSNKMKNTEALAARMLVPYEQNCFEIEFLMSISLLADERSGSWLTFWTV